MQRPLPAKLEIFTGKDSAFEEPSAPDLLIDTAGQSIEDSVITLLEAVSPQTLV